MKTRPSDIRQLPRIGVLGPNQCNDDQYALGRHVGRLIAEHGGTLLCGGLGGMMSAAAEGARSANGLTIGLLPGPDADDANEWIDLPLPTGLGAFRNMLLVKACDVVIAIHGAYGTLSEIAFALRLGTPVIGLHTWSVHRNGQPDPGIQVAETAEQAVQLAFAACRANR